MTKVVALAGGVGGAKLAWGLTKVIPQDDLTIIVNTADDFVQYGLKICPDLDTVMYTLAELSNKKTGWGRENETWDCFNELFRLDPDTWFQLGDLDLANHMKRTQLLDSGKSLTEVTEYLCEQNHIRVRLLPMTDDLVSTIITTDQYGEISFQEYFVKFKYQPELRDYHYEGIDKAKLNTEAQQFLEDADIVILCPSNPWLSILPILSVQNLKLIISKKVCIAVSPIVGSSAVKGPAAKIFIEKGIHPCAVEVANIYKDFINGFVLDHKNKHEYEKIKAWGIIPMVTDTIMKDDDSKIRLAKEVFDFAQQFTKGK